MSVKIKDATWISLILILIGVVGEIVVNSISYILVFNPNIMIMQLWVRFIWLIFGRIFIIIIYMAIILLLWHMTHLANMGKSYRMCLISMIILVALVPVFLGLELLLYFLFSGEFLGELGVVYIFLNALQSSIPLILMFFIAMCLIYILRSLSKTHKKVNMQ